MTLWARRERSGGLLLYPHRADAHLEEQHPPTMTGLLLLLGRFCPGICLLYYTLYSLISVLNSEQMQEVEFIFEMSQYCPVRGTIFGANFVRANAPRTYLHKVNEKCVACISTPSCFLSSQLIKFIQNRQQQRDKSRSSFLTAGE